MVTVSTPVLEELPPLIKKHLKLIRGTFHPVIKMKDPVTGEIKEHQVIDWGGLTYEQVQNHEVPKKDDLTPFIKMLTEYTAPPPPSQYQKLRQQQQQQKKWNGNGGYGSNGYL